MARIGLVAATIYAIFGLWMPWRTRVPAPATPPLTELGRAIEAAPAVDFQRDIQPILTARCQPCHFPGGVMYTRLPFDQAGTIRELGTRLFTRIRGEKEQALLKAFLAQQK